MPVCNRWGQNALQLEAAKGSVTAARREELGCRSYKIASWEAAQSRSSPYKWLPREEVAEEEVPRQSRSVKKQLNKEK